MLQQTQVERVIPKFNEFMTMFPTIRDLAAADLGDVLALWSGLGYNRRAKFLHQAAERVVESFDGEIPSTFSELLSLPGVGPNTAGAILAYAFNEPSTFIETNVRTVYFHHFFAHAQSVSDKELRDVVEATIDREHPREWYWALMDYGSFLKKNGSGAIDKSLHYKKQSALKGSVREVRGLILKALTVGPLEESELRRLVPDDDRFPVALAALEAEGMIHRAAGKVQLPIRTV